MKIGQTRPAQKHMDHGSRIGRRGGIVILTPLIGCMVWGVIIYVLLTVF